MVIRLVVVDLPAVGGLRLVHPPVVVVTVLLERHPVATVLPVALRLAEVGVRRPAHPAVLPVTVPLAVQFPAVLRPAFLAALLLATVLLEVHPAAAAACRQVMFPPAFLPARPATVLPVVLPVTVPLAVQFPVVLHPAVAMGLPAVLHPAAAMGLPVVLHRAATVRPAPNRHPAVASAVRLAATVRRVVVVTVLPAERLPVGAALPAASCRPPLRAAAAGLRWRP